jgi:hypothetical protein
LTARSARLAVRPCAAPGRRCRWLIVTRLAAVRDPPSPTYAVW